MTTSSLRRRRTTLLDGTAVAAGLRARAAAQAARVTAATGQAPTLATLQVGEDPASIVYLAALHRAARDVGIHGLPRRLPVNADQVDVAAVLDALAVDPDVHGILLQLPLPTHLDSADLIDRIPANKDIDGLTSTNAGLLTQGQPALQPGTPLGVIALLDAANIPLRGTRVVVVGWGRAVGRPLAQLLLHRGATVTVAHKDTRDLPAVTRTAEVLIVAAGVPGLIGTAHVAPGATVIDVGMHRTAAGLVGDVRAAEIDGVAARRTPVPGGVGPMTIAMLLGNVLRAAEASG